MNKAKAIEGLIALEGVSDADLLAALVTHGLVDEAVTTIGGMPADVIEMVYEDVANPSKPSDLLADIKAKKEKEAK